MNALAQLHAASADHALECGDVEAFVSSIQREINARGGL